MHWKVAGQRRRRDSPELIFSLLRAVPATGTGYRYQIYNKVCKNPYRVVSRSLNQSGRLDLLPVPCIAGGAVCPSPFEVRQAARAPEPPPVIAALVSPALARAGLRAKKKRRKKKHGAAPTVLFVFFSSSRRCNGSRCLNSRSEGSPTPAAVALTPPPASFCRTGGTCLSKAPGSSHVPVEGRPFFCVHLLMVTTLAACVLTARVTPGRT